jgi:hypothetical protein
LRGLFEVLRAQTAPIKTIRNEIESDCEARQLISHRANRTDERADEPTLRKRTGDTGATNLRSDIT